VYLVKYVYLIFSPAIALVLWVCVLVRGHVHERVSS